MSDVDQWHTDCMSTASLVPRLHELLGLSISIPDSSSSLSAISYREELWDTEQTSSLSYMNNQSKFSFVFLLFPFFVVVVVLFFLFINSARVSSSDLPLIKQSGL